MSSLTSIPLSAIPVGTTLVSPIHDHRQTRLLAAGIEVTEQLLLSLRRRAIDSVFVSQQDLARIHAFRPQGQARTALPHRPNLRTAVVTEVSRSLDFESDAMPSEFMAPSAIPFAECLSQRRPVSYDPSYTSYLADEHERSIRHLDTLIQNVSAGDSSDLRLVGGVIGNRLDQAIDDFDAFICLGANPFGMPYPGRHSAHVAILAMAIGATMGLDHQSIVELGFGCWIHDIGMIDVDPRVLKACRVLGPGEFSEITKHPIKTFELIQENVDCVPTAARMVAYQMHERANGSGYPRGRMLVQTHPLARIAAVADTFTALVAARPHRAGMQPYYAVEKLLKDGKDGLFDPKVIRGLLETVGLFPVGSFVELNDEHLVGRVIRSGGNNFSKPVVEVWRKSNLVGVPAVVDLAQEDKLCIAKPLTSLE